MTAEPTDPDDDWAMLQGAWRAAELEPDGVDLRVSVAREKRRLVRDGVLEAIVAIAAAAIFAWLARGADETGRMLLTALAILALLSPVATTLWRRAIWAAGGESLRDYAAFLRKRAVFGLWVGRAGYLGGPIGVAVGAGLSLIGVGFGSAVDPGAIRTLLAVAGVGLVASIAWSLGEARRSRHILQVLDAQHARGVEEPAGRL